MVLRVPLMRSSTGYPWSAKPSRATRPTRMAGVDNTLTKNSTTGIQNPFQQNSIQQTDKTNWHNKLTQQTATSMWSCDTTVRTRTHAVLQRNETSSVLLTVCNPFVFILCKIIYVLLRLNVHNIHLIAKWSAKQWGSVLMELSCRLLRNGWRKVRAIMCPPNQKRINSLGYARKLIKKLIWRKAVSDLGKKSV